MNIYSFISKNLGSTSKDVRRLAREQLYKSALTDNVTFGQLKDNLSADNLDIVLESLQVLIGITVNYPVEKTKLSYIVPTILKIAQKQEHFSIRYYCYIFVSNLNNISGEFKSVKEKIYKLIIQKKMIRYVEDNQPYRQCDHFLEYTLGESDYKYRLQDVCNTFQIDCKETTKKLMKIMKQMGFEEKRDYWKDVDVSSYEKRYKYKTKRHYYAYHGIHTLIVSLLKKHAISQKQLDDLIQTQIDFDPFCLFAEQESKPPLIKSDSLNTTSEDWFKKRVTQKDALELNDFNNEWFALYEQTNIRFEDRFYKKHNNTCLIEKKIKDSSVSEAYPVSYSYPDERKIIEIDSERKDLPNLTIDNHNREEIKENLYPLYGSVTKTENDFTYLFPSEDLVRVLNLKQKSFFEFTHGNELVIQSITWTSGFYEHGVRDEPETAEDGFVLLIKSSYLKKYLKLKKLNIFAYTDIERRKIDRYGSRYKYEYDESKRKKILKRKEFKKIIRP